MNLGAPHNRLAFGIIVSQDILHRPRKTCYAKRRYSPLSQRALYFSGLDPALVLARRIGALYSSGIFPCIVLAHCLAFAATVAGSPPARPNIRSAPPHGDASERAGTVYSGTGPPLFRGITP